MKIGFVGGYGHECIKLFPGAELSWACDDYDRRALERAKAFGCTRTFPSMQAMLDEFEPDIVYIGSVYAHNGLLAIRALEQGFDVVCEKPVAADWETLDRLASLTASGERRIIGEFAMRWTESFQKARDVIQSGAIGKPALIQAQKTYKFGTARPDFYRSRELFGGIIPWVAIHAMDFTSWCTGLHFESASAMQGKCRFADFPEMEDHAVVLFEMTGGVPCVVTADFLRPQGASSHGDDRLRVSGSEGTLEVRNDDVFLTDAREEQHWICKTQDASASQRAIDLVEAALGLADSKITTRECLHVTAAALAARDAAEQGGKTFITRPCAVSAIV